MNYRLILAFAFIFSSLFLSAENALSDLYSSEPIDLSQTVAKVQYAKTQKKLKKEPIQESKTPYWVPLESLEKKGSVFFQPNVGLGLLYFHRVSGNFADVPDDQNIDPSIPFKRGLSYNRTLLKDYQFGYRFFDWFKVALSYQNQAGMFLYTQPLPFTRTGEVIPRYIQQTAYFSLNALQIKAYLELPYALVFKKLVITPFGAAGIGPGWQTWVPVKNRFQRDFTNSMVVFNPQVVPNFTFVLDKGFRLQPAVVNPAFSALLGFKFMFWGQARNLCELQKEGTLKAGNFKPFRIKTIYSFVPYVGFQWNFPATRYDYAKHKKVYNSEMDRFFIHQKYTIDPPKVFAQFNFGPNFLYFSGIKGNLGLQPAEMTAIPTADIPYDQKFKYNRVPLYEYILGARLSKTFQIGLSMQTSSYNVIQTPYVDRLNPIAGTNIKLQFKSFLNLYALMAKAYIYFPYAFRAGFVSMNYYCSLGFGPSWQSWYNTQTNYVPIIAGVINNRTDFSFHSKTIANPAMMVDMGFDMKNAHPDALFHIYAGIRFNLWGQVRNLGKASQQPYQPAGLASPLRVKTLYSFTPYLSFQWDFSVATQGDYLNRQYTNTWAPFLAKTNEFENRSLLFFQTNVGPNFLRFAGVQGDYANIPTPTDGVNNFSAPNQGRLSKNNSLLYEFLFGYKVNYWFSCALSLQSQTGLYISSKAVPEYSANGGIGRATSQLQSQVQLYSVMLKPYFELPKALILKNWAWSPYLGAGLGASWQSWNNNQIYRTSDTNDATSRAFNTTAFQLRSKATPSVAWMIDAGLRTRNISPKFNASIVMGCKYNQWGHVINIGQINQQWPLMRQGIRVPFSVKTVYSWAPYLGFQWNF